MTAKRFPVGCEVHNLRYGFACNSSSTHSIIIPFENSEVVENAPGRGDYGWDCFTCKTEGSKRRYLAAQLAGCLPYDTPVALKKLLLSDWLGVTIAEGEEIPTVDHQSQFSFPYTYDGDFISKEFFTELAGVIINGPAVILGGNDNGDRHPNEGDGYGFHLPLPQDNNGGSQVRCRKDVDPTTGDSYWSVFNKNTGEKVRLTLTAEGLKRQ